MAKMFYTTEEVAEKLGKTVEEVLEMARRGQIQEFRDRDKVMFKVDQIDLLGGDDGETSIPLALDESGESFSALSGAMTREEEESAPLDLSGTGMPTVEASGTGIGLADSGGSNVGGMPAADRGETSSLLDLTRESEETSLGAELLEDIYASDDNVEIPAATSGMFGAVEEAGEAAPAIIGGRVAAQPFVPMAAAAVVEEVDPGWSGLSAGLMVGAFLGIAAVGVVAITLVSGGGSDLARTFAENLYAWAGGLLGVTIVGGVAGFLIGRATG
jgi:hypothetical protein